MNKKHYFYTCLLLLAGASAVLWGCLRDTDHNPGEAEGQQAQFSVAEAREFFETISQSITIQGISQNDSNGVKVIPLWELGKSFLSDDVATVETSLNITPFYSWVDGSYDLMTHGKILINTVMVLVAQKDGNGEISFRVVKFIADDDYMKDRPRKFISSPLSVLPDFSGKVIYYDLEGNPLEGTVYESGHRTGELFPAVGKTETTLRGEDPDENHHYECFTIQWKDPTRNGGVLPEVVIVGEPAPFSSSICYYDYQGSDGWGSGGGGGIGWILRPGGGSGSNPVKKITLSLSKSNYCLGESFTIQVEKENLTGCGLKCKIAPYEKAENDAYYDVLGEPGTYLCKMPGKYVIVAETECDGEKIASNKVNLEIVFPDRNEIMAMSEIISAIDVAWNSTVSDAGPSQYREHGFVAYINTRGDKRIIDINTRQSPYAPYSGSGVQINLGYDKDQPQKGDFVNGGRYVFFLFHTHPPFFNATGGTYRRYARITPPIGGSTGDLSADIPAATKDYPGVWNIQYNNFMHTNMDPISSPQLWHYGPARRTKYPL